MATIIAARHYQRDGDLFFQSSRATLIDRTFERELLVSAYEVSNEINLKLETPFLHQR
ncbi:hypothetical protein O9929_11785 [Vibrio lentus]|nr:hypothetical protein [Vibrio lentus]